MRIGAEPDLSPKSFPVREAAATRRLRLLAQAGLIGLAAVAAMPRAASAQGFQGNGLMDSAMELFGLKEEEAKPEIDYRERSPLVVPPKTPDVLPPPMEARSQPHPNWPKDPDVARRKREAEGSKAPIVRDDPGRPLMPSELKAGRKQAVGNSSSPTEPVGAESKRDVLLPDQLGFKGWFGGNGKQEQMTFNGEPTRENLIQPPPGYQTPAPNAPYGVVEPKKEQWKIPNLFDRTN